MMPTKKPNKSADLTAEDIAKGFERYNAALCKLYEDVSGMTDKENKDGESISSLLQKHSDRLDKDIAKLRDWEVKLKANLKESERTHKIINASIERLSDANARKIAATGRKIKKLEKM